MKKIVLFSLMMACMPFMVLAQSGNDDLYYIPKKKKEQKEKVETKTVVKTEQANIRTRRLPSSLAWIHAW